VNPGGGHEFPFSRRRKEKKTRTKSRSVLSALKKGGCWKKTTYEGEGAFSFSGGRKGAPSRVSAGRSQREGRNTEAERGRRGKPIGVWAFPTSGKRRGRSLERGGRRCSVSRKGEYLGRGLYVEGLLYLEKRGVKSARRDRNPEGGAEEGGGGNASICGKRKKRLLLSPSKKGRNIGSLEVGKEGKERCASTGGKKKENHGQGSEEERG